MLFLFVFTKILKIFFFKILIIFKKLSKYMRNNFFTEKNNFLSKKSQTNTP